MEFETGDPAFTGEMTITTTLVPASGGTEVTFTTSNVPAGIRPEDHHKGIIYAQRVTRNAERFSALSFPPFTLSSYIFYPSTLTTLYNVEIRCENLNLEIKF